MILESQLPQARDAWQQSAHSRAVTLDVVRQEMERRQLVDITEGALSHPSWVARWEADVELGYPTHVWATKAKMSDGKKAQAMHNKGKGVSVCTRFDDHGELCHWHVLGASAGPYYEELPAVFGSQESQNWDLTNDKFVRRLQRLLEDGKLPDAVNNALAGQLDALRSYRELGGYDPLDHGDATAKLAAMGFRQVADPENYPGEDQLAPYPEYSGMLRTTVYAAESGWVRTAYVDQDNFSIVLQWVSGGDGASAADQMLHSNNMNGDGEPMSLHCPIFLQHLDAAVTASHRGKR